VATLAMAGSGRGWLGAVVARQVAGCNGWCVLTGGFLVCFQYRLFAPFTALMLLDSHPACRYIHIHTYILIYIAPKSYNESEALAQGD